jgi:hypothetical protein
MSSRIIGLLLGVFVVVASAVPAEAQIGGFLKKKAKEAAQAPVKQEQAKQQSDEAAASALSDPDIVPITQESTVRFRKALGIELRLRGEFRTFLASLKTREEYDACKSEFMMSPEAQQASMQMLNLGDKATPADMQKAMMKAAADVEALTKKRCGGDPSAWNGAKRNERLQEIEGEASDAFGPPGAAPPAGDGLVVLPPGPSASSAEAEPADAHPYRRKYALAKERWIPFCNGMATAPDATGKGKYATVKGEGNGVYVYSSEEAAVMAANCVDVMSEIGKVVDAAGRPKLP